MWFVFGGMGSQWPGMASDLMEIPCFADSIKRCDNYTRPIGYDLIDIITNPDPEVLKRDPVHAFLAISSIHVSKSKTKILYTTYFFRYTILNSSGKYLNF